MARVMTGLSEQELLDLAAFGAVKPIDTTGYGPTDLVTFLAQAVKDVQAVLASFREAAHQARRSNRYTEAGLAQMLAEAALTYLPLLDKSRLIDNARAKLDEVRGSMTATEKPDAAVLIAAIWHWLPVDDSLEMRRIFDEAIQHGEKVTYDAVRTLPRFRQPLVPEDIAEGEAKWAAKRSPEKAKVIRDLSNAISVLEQVIKNTREAIEQEARLPQSDPVARVAAEGGEV
jgi:hypothetical protein